MRGGDIFSHYNLYFVGPHTLDKTYHLGLHDLWKYRNTTEIPLFSLINFDILCQSTGRGKVL